MRRLGAILSVLLVVALFQPAFAAANTISVSQTITITAYVAPARSIVVDQQGRMTTIFSNTDENVEPKVYLNKVHGEQRELTTSLRQQYDQILAEHKNLVGIEIPVEPPVATDESVQRSLFDKVSIFLMKF